jgi:hypothetical protein
MNFSYATRRLYVDARCYSKLPNLPSIVSVPKEVEFNLIEFYHVLLDFWRNVNFNLFEFDVAQIKFLLE